MSNKEYNISDIASIVKGELYLSTTDFSIHQLSIDSRKIVKGTDVLFFAIVGSRNNGHDYIDELIQKGIQNFVVSDKTVINRKKGNFILCKNTLSSLQKLVIHHKKLFQVPTIGITGSNGKTIVKEWLAQMISPEKQIIRSPKSYNSQVGVPLSVWPLGDEDELGIFEAGISMPNEMEALEQMIQPNIGVLTNIGEAHSANFNSIEEKLAEKLKLFKNCEVLFYHDKYLPSGSIPTINNELSTLSIGDSENSYLQIKSADSRSRSTVLIGIIDGITQTLEIPFTDQASIENASLCWAILNWMQYDLSVIQERFNWLQTLAMRLEMKEGIQQTSIINDAYSNDIRSLEIALDFLSQQSKYENRCLILSDIQQSNKKPELLYKEVASLVSKHRINRLIGIGEMMTKHQHLFQSDQNYFYLTTKAFLKEFDFKVFSNEAILLKGGRIFSFEDISRRLQYKTHETVLEISLNAIEHNLNYFKEKLNQDVMLMCMVKAFSYGAGSFEIANLLQFHHVNYLGVAYADEGFELRKNGISLPIMVMSPERRSFYKMIQQRLEPELHNFDLLDEFLEELSLYFPEKEAYPIHIKLDTGMHRLGFEQNDLDRLIDFLLENKNKLRVKSIFSHLAASDEMEHDEFTHHQINLFDNLSQQIIDRLEYPVIRHIANSGGIQRFPDAQFDMVRLGIGLYGIGANATVQKKLLNVSRFVSSIVQIRTIKKGDTIGYGRKGIATKTTQLATVMLGYADGLNRGLSDGKGTLYVHNKPAPIVGRVCMDMCMIDITGIKANIGDEVVVFDNQHPISLISDKLNTIPYEIMTSISSRVKRIYYQE